MVDISRHGPGITVVECGEFQVMPTVLGICPWFRRMISKSINLKVEWIHLRGEKKKDPTLTFLSDSSLGFFVGCIYPVFFGIDYCKSRKLYGVWDVSIWKIKY
jgi:hypothetical protein